MIDDKIINDLNQKTEDYIRDTYSSLIDAKSIDLLVNLRRDIEYILLKTESIKDESNWFDVSFDYVVSQFLSLFKNIRSNSNSGSRIKSTYQYLIYGTPHTSSGNTLIYTIPHLKNYVDTQVNKNIIESTLPIQEFKTGLEETITLKEEFKASLAILNKEVGKVGVKMYAEIFEDQALEHSNFFKPLKETDKVSWYHRIGKAEIWIATGLLFTIILGCLFHKLEDWFPLVETISNHGQIKVVTNSTAYTPTVVVHMLSRIVTISFCIFFISFSFKQYRVNMHLYTMNKHRANTLKSFEYLTKAPDPLEPASYNAILMKVAEAIYESGQTGYISNTDTNHDMPSFIDMTKIITPQNRQSSQ